MWLDAVFPNKTVRNDLESEVVTEREVASEKRKRECNNKVHEGNSFLKNNSSAIIYPNRMTFFYSSFTHILFCT